MKSKQQGYRSNGNSDSLGGETAVAATLQSWRRRNDAQGEPPPPAYFLWAQHDAERVAVAT